MAGPAVVLWGETSTGEQLPILVNDDGEIIISSHFKGLYADEAALNAAWPTAESGDHALVSSTNTVWLWDGAAWVDTGVGSLVSTVFGRIGDVVAVADDYTWAQIDKAVSDLADLATKSHISLTDKGTNTHAQIDTAIALEVIKTTIQTLTDAATVAWNAATGYKAKVTLTANRTMGAPTNLVAGDRYVLYCIQDGVGSQTLDFSNAIFKFPGGTEPILSTAAGSVDVIVFEYNGTSLFGVANYAFS